MQQNRNGVDQDDGPNALGDRWSFEDVRCDDRTVRVRDKNKFLIWREMLPEYLVDLSAHFRSTQRRMGKSERNGHYLDCYDSDLLSGI